MSESEHASSPLTLLLKHGVKAIKIIQQIMPDSYVTRNESATGLDVYITYTIPYYDIDDVYDKVQQLYVGTVKVIQQNGSDCTTEDAYEALSDEQIVSEAKHVRDDYIHMFDQIASVVSKWKEAKKNAD